jgi:hypothetical protein
MREPKTVTFPAPALSPAPTLRARSAGADGRRA